MKLCCTNNKPAFDSTGLTIFFSLQLQGAYQDKDDECRRLKRYIDTILLNIVENHPQLLEIKSSSSY